MAGEVTEQHFILRVQSPELAAKLRGWLRDAVNIDGALKLLFETGAQRRAQEAGHAGTHRSRTRAAAAPTPPRRRAAALPPQTATASAR